MAQICEQCGKKIGVFSNDYISIGNYRVLCYDCTKPIRSDLSLLYSTRTLIEFNECRKRILENSMGNFNEEVLAHLVEYIDEFKPNKNEELKQIELEKIKQEKNERERIERERILREYNQKIDNLNKMGFDGYYEYKVVSLNDDNAGGIYSSTIENTLNQLGLDGWHLRCAYSNELGKNSNSGGYGGFSTGTNSTVDQNILIFERFVRINKE